jgi:hypothetical protein
MKTKNLVLGLLAVVFAVGSAFTSVKLTSVAAHVKIKTSASQPNFDCEAIGFCEDTGTEPCRVGILMAPAPGTIKYVQAYRPDCSTLLTNTSGDVEGTYEEALVVAEDNRDL